MPKGKWDKVSKYSAYTKNRIPHKSLQEKMPIEVLLNKEASQEQKNLHPFEQKVICLNYQETDKLSAQSYRARIV